MTKLLLACLLNATALRASPIALPSSEAFNTLTGELDPNFSQFSEQKNEKVCSALWLVEEEGLYKVITLKQDQKNKQKEKQAIQFHELKKICRNKKHPWHA